LIQISPAAPAILSSARSHDSKIAVGFDLRRLLGRGQIVTKAREAQANLAWPTIVWQETHLIFGREKFLSLDLEFIDK